MSVTDTPTGLSAAASLPMSVAAPSAPVVTAHATDAWTAAATTGSLATFSPIGPNTIPADYAATTDFGDHTAPVPGTITANPDGTFAVSAPHAYAAAGAYTQTTTITHTSSGLSDAQSAAVTVADTALAATLAPLYTRAGTAYHGVIATFTDSNPAALASDLSATVDYGDGLGPQPATVQPTGTPGAFRVIGQVTYAAEGISSVSVHVADSAGGGSTDAGGNANTAPSLQSALGVLGIKGYREGDTFSGEVATFRDSNPTGGPYSATINWMGQGALAEPATISGIGPGKFAVYASGHTFTEEGNQMFSVSIHAGAHLLLAVGTADVLDEKILPSDGCNHANVPLGQTDGPDWTVPDSAVVATFTSNYAAAPITDFSAVIHWGDGQTSDGTITPSAFNAGSYGVTGGHVYTGPGCPRAWVAIKDDDVTRAVVGTMVIIDGPGPNNNAPRSSNPDRQPTLKDDTVPQSDPGTSDDPYPDGSGTGTSDSGDSSNTPDTRDPDQPTDDNTDATGTIHLSGRPVESVEGQSLPPGTILGTFTDDQTLSDPGDPESAPLTAADYTATATLPDGVTTLNVTVAPGPDGSYDVVTTASSASAATAFTEESTAEQTIALTVNQSARADAAACAFSVTDAPLGSVRAAPTLRFQAGQFSTVQIGSFQDKDPNNTDPADFVGTVDWGDGATSAATFAYDAGAGRFDVFGAHQYDAQSDGQPVGALVTDTDGQALSGGSADRGQCLIGNTAIVDAVHPFTITGEQVAFTNSQTILRDDGTGAYAGPQWKDMDQQANGEDDRTGTAKGFPVSYVRSTAAHPNEIDMTVTFATDATAAKPLPDGLYVVEGMSMDSSYGLFAAWQGYTTLHGGNTIVANVTPENSLNSLGSLINNAELNLWWSVRYIPLTDNGVASDTQFAPSSSVNHLYVTGAAQANGQFETVIDVGCRAKGFAPDDAPGTATPGNQAVLDAIWSEFDIWSEGDVKQLKDVRGTVMSYWNPPPTATTLDDSVGFLVKNDHGSCGSWARFLRDVLKSQGVAAQVRAVVPAIVPTGWLVVEHKRATTLAVIPAPAQGDPTTIYDNGNPYKTFGPAADNIPATWYQNHALVTSTAEPQKVFDPSYGDFEAADATIGVGAEVVWEQKHLMGWQYNSELPVRRATDALHNNIAQSLWLDTE